MKLKNISKDEQRVFPPEGAPFVCAPGAETPDVADVCGNDLLGNPSVWEAVDVKPKKPKKEK